MLLIILFTAILKCALATDYDIAVLGGGPIGLTAAIEASNRGQKVIVVEQFDFENQDGSSAGDTRQYREMYSQDYLSELAEQSIPKWRDLEKEADFPANSLLIQKGYLFFGNDSGGETTEGSMEGIIKTCQERKMNCEMLKTKEEISLRFPFSNLPPVYKGVYHPDSGYINMPKTLKAAVKVCQKKGVSMKSKTEVVDIISYDDGSFKVVTSKEDFTTKKIMITAGAYTNRILKHFDLKVNISIWELPSAYFKLKEEAPLEFPTWFVFGANDSDLYYGFPEVDFSYPGYVRIAPDFTTSYSLIKDPSERKNKPDPETIRATVEFVRNHVTQVTIDDHKVSPNTCLATILKDDGFILDNLPSHVKNNKNVVVFLGGWAAKFVPLFGYLSTTLLVDGNTGSYNISNFPIAPHLIPVSEVKPDDKFVVFEEIANEFKAIFAQEDSRIRNPGCHKPKVF